MMSFNADPAVAHGGMRAVLFFLLVFAYIDGEFDRTERAFVRDFIDKLVARRAVELYAADAASRGYALPRWKAHYYQVMDGIEHEIRGYLTESVAEGESAAGF